MRALEKQDFKTTFLKETINMVQLSNNTLKNILHKLAYVEMHTY